MKFPPGVPYISRSQEFDTQTDRWTYRQCENIMPPATAVAGAEALCLLCLYKNIIHINNIFMVSMSPTRIQSS